MEIRIATLSENTANYSFLAEWGLSILIEVDGLKILMDTGLSFSAVHNAQLMGIDLSTIDRIETAEKVPSSFEKGRTQGIIELKSVLISL